MGEVPVRWRKSWRGKYAGTPTGRQVEISTTTDEFTSVCPFSGLPDFARVTIVYTPNRRCIELRSLKYYLMSYRDVGIWYEHHRLGWNYRLTEFQAAVLLVQLSRLDELNAIRMKRVKYLKEKLGLP